MKMMKVEAGWRLMMSMAVLMCIALVGVFWGTVVPMVSTWSHSETFAHGFIIVPISVWLVWNKRFALIYEKPNPDWKGLPVLVGVVLVWLMGDLGGAQVVSQYAFMMMFPVTAWILLGWPIVRQILFPLLFLLLAVPFGDVFIDPLIDVTADFTVAALQMTGVPVFREGNTFSIPSGNWSVVTACSGVRYLIASFTLGCIYAYLTYRTFWRRALFMVAAVIVPIVANGMRAYMIVMIGHLSDMKLAVGVDHLIYGWLFFGVVMLVLFWVGSFWREDEEPVMSSENMQGVVAPPPPLMNAWQTVLVFVVILACIAAGPFYSRLVSDTMAQQAEVTLARVAIPGWTETGTAFTQWHPEFKAPAAEEIRYFSRQGHLAGFYVGYYRNQRQGAELVNYLNVLAFPGGKVWRRLNESRHEVAAADTQHVVRESRLTDGSQQLMAWHWYWLDGRSTPSDFTAKASLAWNRLLLRADDGAVVVLFSPMTERAEQVRATLSEFAMAATPAIETALEKTRAK